MKFSHSYKRPFHHAQAGVSNLQLDYEPESKTYNIVQFEDENQENLPLKERGAKRQGVGQKKISL